MREAGMQPCGMCGGTAVDANGLCTGCRAYRGLTQPEPAPTSTYPTAYELIDPSVGGPYAGPTAPPYQAGFQQPHPTHAPPHQPAPTRRRSQFVVPLIALSATLLVAIVAIVVVAVVRSGEKRRGPLVDPCVVGNWTQTQRTGDTTAQGLNG